MPQPIPMLRFRNASLDDTESIVDLVRRGSRGDASKRGWTSEADLVEGLRIDADQVSGMMSPNAEIILVRTPVTFLRAATASALLVGARSAS